MTRYLALIFIGMILTCLTNPEHNEYTEFQLDEAILFQDGQLSFTDEKGDKYIVEKTVCVLMEGTIKAPGEDMRQDRLPEANCAR